MVPNRKDQLVSYKTGQWSLDIEISRVYVEVPAKLDSRVSGRDGVNSQSTRLSKLNYLAVAGQPVSLPSSLDHIRYIPRR